MKIFFDTRIFGNKSIIFLAYGKTDSKMRVYCKWGNFWFSFSHEQNEKKQRLFLMKPKLYMRYVNDTITESEKNVEHD